MMMVKVRVKLSLGLWLGWRASGDGWVMVIFLPLAPRLRLDMKGQDIIRQDIIRQSTTSQAKPSQAKTRQPQDKTRLDKTRQD